MHNRRGRENSVRAENICAGNRSGGVVASNKQHSPVLEQNGRRARTRVSHGIPRLPGSGGNVRNRGCHQEDARQDKQGQKPSALAQAHFVCLPTRKCSERSPLVRGSSGGS